MLRHIIAAGAALAATATLADAVEIRPVMPATSVTLTPPQTHTNEMSRADALAALQDARVTIAGLTEASMSQDARERLARVSSAFRALYRAWTGEAPTAEKTAAQAAQSKTQPRSDWERSYDAMQASIDGLIEKARASQTAGAAVTTSSSAAQRIELTVPVRQRLQALRYQMMRFHDYAKAWSVSGEQR